MKFWLEQTLIALDQLANAVICGGWADETMSSYCYRMWLQEKPWGMMRPVLDGVARACFRDPDHCRRSYESERLRSQLPPELRGILG